MSLEDFDFSVFAHDDTEIDHEMRRNGLTGSDVAAITGAHPYRKAWDVWATKTGLVTAPPLETEGAEIGTTYQLPTCYLYQKRSGNAVRWFDKTVQHPVFKWAVCTPDGIIRQLRLDGKKGLYEGKTAGSRMVTRWGAEWTDDIPREYMVQGAWNCIVTESDYCDYGVLLGTQPLSVRCYRVEPSPELRSHLFMSAKHFWEYNIQGKHAPEIQSSKLADLWFAGIDDKADFRDASESELVLIRELDVMQRADVKNPAREEDIKAKLKASIGEAAGLIGPWGVLRYKRNKDTVSVNYEEVVKELQQSNASAVIDEVIKAHTKTRRGARPLILRAHDGAFTEGK